MGARTLPRRASLTRTLAFAALPLALMVASREAAAATNAATGSIGLVVALLSLLALYTGSTPAMAGGLMLAVLAVPLLAFVAHRAWQRRRGWRVALPAAGPVLPQVERDALLAMARERFLELQRAWDAADVDALRALTTPEMLEELLAPLEDRGLAPNRTDVLRLEARLVAFDHIGPLELASLEFSGIVRESAERGPVPFREVWMLARSRQQGGDWRLARQQALL